MGTIQIYICDYGIQWAQYIYEYASLWAQWGLRNVHSRPCLAASRLLRETQRAPAPAVVLCGNVRVPAEGSRVAHTGSFQGLRAKEAIHQFAADCPAQFFIYRLLSAHPLLPKPSSEFTNVTILESSIPPAAKYDQLKESCEKKHSCIYILQNSFVW